MDLQFDNDNDSEIDNDENYNADDVLINFDNDMEQILESIYIEKECEKYYQSDINIIPTRLLYVNETNIIESITKSQLKLSKPNVISSDDIVFFLKSNFRNNYMLLYMFVLNLDQCDTDGIFASKKEGNFNVSGKEITFVNDTQIVPTISLLNNTNEVILVLQRKNILKNHNKTRIHKMNNKIKNKNKNKKTRKNI